jgi:quercetin dioxygenase-like cupin family protein
MDIWDLTTVAVEPRKPVVLHSNEGAARVIAINLPAGDELGEHEVHEHAWLHVHRGSVELSDEDGSDPTRAGAGSLVHWAPKERHRVTAVEDALLALILAPWPGPGHPSLRSAQD